MRLGRVLVPGGQGAADESPHLPLPRVQRGAAPILADDGAQHAAPR